MDAICRAAFHLRTNTSLDDPGLIALGTDEQLAKGTLLERIEREARLRTERFHAMLSEKYEAIDDQDHAALVRCRRCGSSEVTWEEKQTRSADEAATLFCVCATCKNRWTMR